MLLYFRYGYRFGGDGLAEGEVVFDKQHSRLKLFYKVFYLDARIKIQVVKRFVPNI